MKISKNKKFKFPTYIFIKLQNPHYIPTQALSAILITGMMAKYLGIGLGPADHNSLQHWGQMDIYNCNNKIGQTDLIGWWLEIMVKLVTRISPVQIRGNVIGNKAGLQFGRLDAGGN